MATKPLIVLLCLAFMNAETLELFNEDQTPKPALKEILVKEKLYDPLDSIQEITLKTREAWIKVNPEISNTERFDLIDSQEQLDRKEDLFFLCKELGLFSKVDPSKSHYQAAIVHGAALQGVRTRVQHLIDLWNSGIRFEEVYFLAGYRPLRLSLQESIEQLLDESLSPLPFKDQWQLSLPYELEEDMIRNLILQMQFPQDFPKIIILKSKGAATRSTMQDNLLVWKQAWSLEPKAILAISSPLIVHHQQLVAKRILGQSFPIETSAKEESGAHLKVSVLLDCLAKIIQELAL